MENDKEHIGDLYQKAFQDAGGDDPEDEDDWHAIAYRLDKKRFFRFAWTRFNVYYSGLIVITFLLLLLFIIRHYTGNGIDTTINQNPGNKGTSASNHTNSNASTTSSSASNAGSSINSTTPNTSYNTRKNRPTSNDKSTVTRDSLDGLLVPGQDGTSALDPSVAADTSGQTNKDNPTEKTLPKKKKRIVHVIQQDTITIVDTTRSRKLRNRQK